ncbi:hypothetical protein KIK06_01545 [Nocardiopsis sp. EMB25]|uniref:hypothetical protein n=1 Tax=Nocardiopsis TaxID=2013 RepID=UPI0003483A36|nr:MULTISPECIES: hypothetical protein [Nocardiopsis]MCY9782571.1 hypothetical protein [Nocardiopsis sp. EMB25]
MSQQHRDHRSRGTLGTALLTGACCAGALAYAVLAGPSLLPPEDVQAASAMSPDLVGPIAEGPQEVAETGPVGQLRIQVSDRDRAWVQTLNCTGDLEEDPEVCAELAQVAAELGGGTGGAGGYGDATARTATAGGTEELFTEVRAGTVCTDQVYGPQRATIEGTWEGQEISTTLTRAGSCEEARWQRLRPLTEQIS